jgi:hypothetical protein
MNLKYLNIINTDKRFEIFKEVLNEDNTFNSMKVNGIFNLVKTLEELDLKHYYIKNFYLFLYFLDKAFENNDFLRHYQHKMYIITKEIRKNKFNKIL